ncbi:MAG: adenylate/guanylate cyclase domain-containing protein [Candidatus Eisenbacteria bacterium]|jgi:adenylate cyclase|nr:adenylate/guanylate cyclase domain-containing protein [Candidatus Eisenbacteria bacterium]
MEKGQQNRPARRLKAPRVELAAVSLVAVMAAALLSLTRPMQRVELMLMDTAQRMVPLAVPDSARVVIVAVDDISYGADSFKFGKWPWPRSVYPPVIDYLVRAGAQVVGFDLYFPVESATSPEDDRRLVRAVMLAGNNCHSVAALGRTGFATPDSIRAVVSERFGVPCGVQQEPHERLITPFPALLEACDCLGHVNVPRDMDGVARRVPIVLSGEGMSVPALSVAMYLWTQGASSSDLRCDDGEVALGDQGPRIPVDARAQALLRFSTPHSPVPFSSVLHAALAEEEGTQPHWRNGTLPPVTPEVFEGRMVIIALTASGLFDLVSCPMGTSVPGVEIQATALENILAGAFVRIAWPGAAVLVAGALAVFAGVALRRWSTPIGLGSSALLGGVYAAVCVAMLDQGWWMGLSLPLLALALGIAGHVVALYLSEGREKRRYRRTFSRYVSRQVVEELLRDPSEVRLKGEQREITVLFCDIRGFTTLSETKTPEEVVAILDEFLSVMVGEVFAHGGTLDKFLGDGMMVFYGAPGHVPDHADRAVQTGLAMIERLNELNARWTERGWPALRLGVGINTGPAVVGSIGSKERMEYTAIGDTVNTASRVQALNKELNTSILVTKTTLESVRTNIRFSPHGSSKIRGRQQEVELFEPAYGEVGDA